MTAYGRSVIRVTYGPHLFGTATPLSDLDFPGIFLPPARDILLGRVRGSVLVQRPKAPGEKSLVCCRTSHPGGSES